MCVTSGATRGFLDELPVNVGSNRPMQHTRLTQDEIFAVKAPPVSAVKGGAKFEKIPLFLLPFPSFFYPFLSSFSCASRRKFIFSHLEKL